MKFLCFYPMASLLETIISSIIYSEFPRYSKLGVPQMLVNIFLLIEFISIYIFFFEVFYSKKIKNLLYVIVCIYISITLGFWIFNNSLYKTPNHLFVPQAIFILMPGLYYLLNLLTNPSRIEPIHEPDFWVVIGLVFYFGGTLPLFLLNQHIDFSNTLHRSVYAINFLSYGILFLLIIKAYLCKKRDIQ